MWNEIRPSVRPSVRHLESAPKHFVGCSRNSVPELSQKVVDQTEYPANSHVVLNDVETYPHRFGMFLANFVEIGYKKSACNPAAVV